VLTNNGSGVFGSNATLSVGNQPVCVVAINIQGGGLPDLICANAGSDTLTVLTNNGRGVFGFNATISVGNHPESVVAADVNGDGELDLVCANYYASTLTVLTNNGRGVFGFSTTISVATGGPAGGPFQIVAADVNGDGTPDFITANLYGNTLTELLTYREGFSLNPAMAFTDPFDVFIGNGSGLTALNASQLTSGTVPLAQLPAAVVTNTETGVTLTGTFTGNVAQLAANQAFTGENVFTGPTYFGGYFELEMGTAGDVVFEGQNVPTMDVSGGSVSGHMRLRNAMEIWPNDAGTAGGYLDVRPTTFGGNNPTIWMSGTNGNITCTSLSQTSDRNVKENFTTIDPQEVLSRVAALPITEWSFKMDAAARHIGPTAQDFHAAFEVGADDKHIATVDEEGVALAAIQGLNQKVEAKDAQIRALAGQLEELKATVKALAGSQAKSNGRTKVWDPRRKRSGETRSPKDS